MINQSFLNNHISQTTKADQETFEDDYIDLDFFDVLDDNSTGKSRERSRSAENSHVSQNFMVEFKKEIKRMHL